MSADVITVYLADDNLIVREGVRALLAAQPDFEVVGTAGDYDELVEGATQAEPCVVVTDIRMPPDFVSEGIDAAKEIRKRHPATGVVILSQYDDPRYAISLLRDGADGYAYLLKDRLAQGDELAKAIRAVAAGHSVLDPKIVEAIVQPVSRECDLSAKELELVRMIAEGNPLTRIAAMRSITPAAASQEVDHVLLRVAQAASVGTESAIEHLHALREALVERDEEVKTLERLLPEGLAEKLKAQGRRIGESERLRVTVMMTDVRGYSRIAETSDPTQLASQINSHRALLNEAIHADGGTVMQFTGDGVLAVFGAPFPQEDHADRALHAAIGIHQRQAALSQRWCAEGLKPFVLGIGLCTGDVAAALLGTDERLEYTLVGDTVNVAARLQDLARPGGSVIMSDATHDALTTPVASEPIERMVKGRESPVLAYRLQVVDA